jgi:segregation and condensation protein A
VLPDTGEEVPMAEVSIFDLINAFNSVLKKATEREDFREIVEEKFTVSDKIEEILYNMRDRSDMVFTEVFARAQSRAEVVVTFLALLELIRLKRLRVRQVESFGEIHVTKVV